MHDLGCAYLHSSMDRLETGKKYAKISKDEDLHSSMDRLETLM